MVNIELAKKIKALRLKNSLTQEELANETNLSLRTIQRIELGETEPRGDTLKRLANVFAITPNDLVEWTEVEDHKVLLVLNISAFSFMLFPLLGVIIPLTLWIIKKDKVKNINVMGKQLLNFQITFCLLVFTFYAYIVFQKVLHLQLIDGSWLPDQDNFYRAYQVLLFTPILFYVYNFIFVTLNCFKSYHTGKVSYFPAIRFLK